VKDVDTITVADNDGPSGSVEFRRGQVVAGTNTFAIVDDPSSTGLVLYTPNEEDAFPGDTVFASTLALGSGETRYYGVPATWQVEGNPVGEVGEVFPYTFDPGATTRTLSVSMGGLVDERDIKIGDGDADVGGCATVPRSGGYLLALLALLSRRRARSRRSDHPRR
jgi:hypothetical protein